MKKILYKMPVVKQIHILHLQVDEIQKNYEKQRKAIREIQKENAELKKTSDRLRKENAELRNTILEQGKTIAKLGKEKASEKDLSTAFKGYDKELKKQMRYDFFKGLPAEKYKEALCEWYYFRMGGHRLDLEHPKTLNEKIQWMKLYDSTPLKTRLADKVAVREWIKQTIGEQYLIPCLGVWESFDEINFDDLPDRFVLKANHGSGWNVIVEDKEDFHKEDARRKLNDWLGKNYAWHGLELHYKNIPPRIYAEEFLEGDNGDSYDYRFFCFHGEIKFIVVDIDWHTSDKRRKIYDAEWKEQNFSMNIHGSEEALAKPDLFEEMKGIAEKLSMGFPFVRVDLYSISGKIYFGEMTFTSMNGTCRFEPEEYDEIFGDMLALPEKTEFEGKLL